MAKSIKVLVTGGRGFISSNLVSGLESGNRVGMFAGLFTEGWNYS